MFDNVCVIMCVCVCDNVIMCMCVCVSVSVSLCVRVPPGQSFDPEGSGERSIGGARHMQARSSCGSAISYDPERCVPL